MGMCQHWAMAMSGKPARQPVRRRREPVTVCVQSCKLSARQVFLEAAREFGWKLFDPELTGGALPADPAPKGAIIEVAAPAALQRRLREAGCAMVAMGSGVEGAHCSMPTVLCDMAAQGRLAADHFFERGFRHVGYVGHSPWAEAKPLYDAFRERAADRGMSCALLQFQSRATASPPDLFKQRSRQVAAWLEDLPRPMGVLTYNDFMGAKVCAMLVDAGLMIPEDVALLGRGNQRYACESSPVELSSIDEGWETVAWQAAGLLRHLLNGEAAPNTPVLIPPGGVVERRSTDVLAIGDLLVARAVRFLWQRIDQDLSVDDVVAEVGVDRQKLERAFRRHLGRGINAELRRKRLEEFRKLLLATDRPIAELAPQTGFRTLAHLHKTFRQVHGMSPRQYRMRRATKT